MARRGTYYVGRVLKFGLLDQEKLIQAIKEPKSIIKRGMAWTFIDVKEFRDPDYHYLFGRLCKYSPEGEISVIDPVNRSQKTQIEPNLHKASSPFLYIPKHSGISFLNVSNQIETTTFIDRFCKIINSTYLDFFVDCDIELISDLKTFADKLISLDGIYQIDARVSPPNPLFNPIWKSLKIYLQGRNTDKMKIVEDAPETDRLKTDLPNIVKKVSEQTKDAQFLPEKEIALGDSAILMAADGYGKGKIKGRRSGEHIVIKTAETSQNFTFEKDPDPHELYLKVNAILENIQSSRHMEHDK